MESSIRIQTSSSRKRTPEESGLYNSRATKFRRLCEDELLRNNDASGMELALFDLSRMPSSTYRHERTVSKSAIPNHVSFLDLPGEIRNYIYEMVLSDPLCVPILPPEPDEEPIPIPITKASLPNSK